MINVHELGLSIDEATLTKIDTLTALTPETFDDDKGHVVLARDIVNKITDDMHPSNLWRTYYYRVGEYDLRKRRHFMFDLTDLTIRKHDERIGNPPTPLTKIVFKPDGEIHEIVRVNYHYDGGPPPKGDQVEIKEHLWLSRVRPPQTR